MRWLICSLVMAMSLAPAHSTNAQSKEQKAKLEETKLDHARAVSLFQKGQLISATRMFADILKRREEIFPPSKYPNGDRYLSGSITWLGFAYFRRGELSKAEPLLVRALRMDEKLYGPARFPRGHAGLAQSLNNLAALYVQQRAFAKAGPLYKRALKMCESLFPPARYPQGHPTLAQSIHNLAVLRQSQGAHGRAENLLQRVLKMCEKLFSAERYPRGHPNLANIIHTLALVHRDQGAYSKAEPLSDRALKMCESLYPARRYPLGHPHLERTIYDRALLHKVQREYAKAELLYLRSLKMCRELYPARRYGSGHPNLIRTINSLAALYHARKEHAKARPLFLDILKRHQERLAKSANASRRLDVAVSLNNLAQSYSDQGDFDKAEPLFLQSIKMHSLSYPKSRYPQGHPDTGSVLDNLAGHYRDQRKFAKAAPLYKQALKIFTAAAADLASTTTDAKALDYLSKLPFSRDNYLSATLKLPKSDPYSSIWQSKASLSRVYEQRHLAILAASLKPVQSLWQQILGLKRQRERLLLTAALGDSEEGTAREKRLDALENQISALRLRLLPKLPLLKQREKLAEATPVQLQKRLATTAVFVDLLRYTRFEHDPNSKGKPVLKKTQCYVAFVVSRDAVKRVELGAADKIEKLVARWRKSIRANSIESSSTARQLSRKVWAPLADQFPPKASVVYISPDLALTRLPWAALPGKNSKRILLQDYTLAVVPHGPFLLESLSKKDDRPSYSPVLAMGGVAYDQKPTDSNEPTVRTSVKNKGKVQWPALQATASELERLTEFSKGKAYVALSGRTASVQRLLRELPKARVAHLATHGFFANRSLRDHLQLNERLFARSRFGERVGVGARNMMVLSGLVCAGANQQGTANRGILSADAIIDLDLRKLDLAVLSACETGLGDVAGGEGVYGLQRAFHIAGADNVIASLWKVDDSATAALMKLFYYKLWKEKKRPIQALRESQLALFHHPERIKELSTSRGPAFDKAVKIVARKADKPQSRKRTSTKLWAAFVLSGLGQ